MTTNKQDETLEDSAGYKIAIGFKPFIDPQCSGHMEIVKGMAKSINSGIRKGQEDTRIFHFGYDKGKEWQKEQDKVIIDKLIEALEMELWYEQNGEAESQRQGRPRYITRLETMRELLNSLK